jgi:hypothetical protein
MRNVSKINVSNDCVSARAIAIYFLRADGCCQYAVTDACMKFKLEAEVSRSNLPEQHRLVKINDDAAISEHTSKSVDAAFAADDVAAELQLGGKWN